MTDQIIVAMIAAAAVMVTAVGNWRAHVANRRAADLKEQRDEIQAVYVEALVLLDKLIRHVTEAEPFVATVEVLALTARLDLIAPETTATKYDKVVRDLTRWVEGYAGSVALKRELRKIEVPEDIAKDLQAVSKQMRADIIRLAPNSPFLPRPRLYLP